MKQTLDLATYLNQGTRPKLTPFQFELALGETGRCGLDIFINSDFTNILISKTASSHNYAFLTAAHSAFRLLRFNHPEIDIEQVHFYELWLAESKEMPHFLLMEISLDENGRSDYVRYPKDINFCPFDFSDWKKVYPEAFKEFSGS